MCVVEEIIVRLQATFPYECSHDFADWSTGKAYGFSWIQWSISQNEGICFIYTYLSLCFFCLVGWPSSTYSTTWFC